MSTTHAQDGALDAAAKLIADHVGHGMREKCESVAAQVLALARDPAPQAPADAGEAVELLKHVALYADGLDGVSYGGRPILDVIADALVGDHPAPAHAAGEWVMDELTFDANDPHDSLEYCSGFNECRRQVLAAAPPPPAGDARQVDGPCVACEAGAGDREHSVQCAYEHFLAYSGLADDPLLRYAYFHGADAPMDKPQPATPADAGVKVIAEVVGHMQDGALVWVNGGGGCDIPDDVELWVIPDVAPVDGSAWLYTTPQPPAPARVEVDSLLAVALEANDLMRSAHAVAERVSTQYATVYAGTNFGALHECLNSALVRHHEVLRPFRLAALAPQADLAGGEVGGHG